MKNKFKIISYIKYPDGSYSSPGEFKLNSGDYTKIVEYYNLFVKKYCALHNYAFEFRELTDIDLEDIKVALSSEWYLLDNSTFDKNINSIILYKLKYIKEVLDRNEDEYVVFFDTDAIPSNPNIKLEQLIDNEHEFFVSPGNKYLDTLIVENELVKPLNDIFNKKEYQELLCIQPPELIELINKKYNVDFHARLDSFNKLFAGFSEGFMIVKNTEKMKQLFSFFVNNYNLGIHRTFNSHADGHLMWYFLSSKYFYSSLKYMPFYSMGHYLGYGPYVYNEDTTFLLHNSDIISMKNRTLLFEIMKNNKWWKSILPIDHSESTLEIINHKLFFNNPQLILNKLNINNYITLDIFYIEKPWNAFLNYMKHYNFKIWQGESINNIKYLN